MATDLLLVAVELLALEDVRMRNMMILYMLEPEEKQGHLTRSMMRILSSPIFLVL